MKPFNQAIKTAGVVWRDCDACGRIWPFPRGLHEVREWHCAVCVQALWAKLQRTEVPSGG